MKKLFLFIITLFILPFTVKAEELINVTIENCSNTSSFWVNINGEVKRIGLIAFDIDDTNLNEEILNYICNKLNNAKSIQIKYDSNYTKSDEYNRDLVWVYVDGELLQKDLIEKGYGKVNYVYGNYENLKDLCGSEKKAIKSNLGIWSLGSSEAYCSNEKSFNSEELKASVNGSSKTFDSSLLKSLLIISSLMLLLLVGIKREG